MSEKKLTITESAVFYLVLSQIKRFGGETYVKQGNVAARLGLARETVCRVIKRLKARGLLKARQRSIGWHQGGRRLISSVYSVGKHWCDPRSQQSFTILTKEKKERIMSNPRLQEIALEPWVASVALLRSRMVKKVSTNSLTRWTVSANVSS